jgi:hypothetical protein
VPYLQPFVHGARVKWTSLEPDVGATNLEEWLASVQFVDAMALLNRLRVGPVLFFSTSARATIVQYTKAIKVESGGLLIGRAVMPGALGSHVPHPLVYVVEAVPSRQSTGTSVSLEMDSDIWTCALQRRPAGSMVVGWFHSHPNLGAFFSGTDRNTQRNFFHHEYSVGYVIDPIRDEHAYFLGPSSIKVGEDNVYRMSEDLRSS